VLVEPPGSDVPRRRHHGPRLALGPGLRGPTAPAAAGAGLVAFVATGDLFVLALVLAVATADLAGAGAILLATAAIAGRWSTSSLGAIVGGQAVVGASGWTGPAAFVVSSWCAAVAIALAGAKHRSSAVAAGITAGLVVAGPSAVTVSGAAVRVAGALAGVGLALLAWRLGPGRVRPTVAIAIAVVALAAMLAGPVSWSWTGAVDAGRVTATMTRVIAAAAFVVVAGRLVGSPASLRHARQSET